MKCRVFPRKIFWGFVIAAVAASSSDAVGSDGSPELNLCPLASEIYPCTCQWDEDLWEPDLSCRNIESVEHLKRIFETAFFPEKRFWRISLSGSPLGDLPADLFNDVQFDEVHLNDCNISSVHPEAFRASKPNMDTLELYSNQLTDDSFPWSTLNEYPKLWRVHLEHNLFTVFPTLISESLEDISLWANPIVTFSRESFEGAPNLRIINVSPYIESFPEDSFMPLEKLEELHLSDNRLGNLVEGQFFLNSPNFEYLYLSNNSIASIQPDAITGITSTRLLLFLDHNLLTNLREEVFMPLMSRMLDGWGGIEFAGNPLVCDCEMYWLLSNATLLSNVRSGTCDGQELADVDISGWEC
ncbi:oplophorus-luciferin 2-monooxygenase non-catalytic subunit-like isoform X2 [Macrobrachium rosenbergii]|uniref:oplophorus-luciferin 2-monooxygenase non-catalytic subunit-like isoform X2 n=1 Tax=Macrobrachium rosenbergii TaxID=79674 RepID=UPI0034D52FAB